MHDPCPLNISFQQCVHSRQKQDALSPNFCHHHFCIHLTHQYCVRMLLSASLQWNPRPLSADVSVRVPIIMSTYGSTYGVHFKLECLLKFLPSVSHLWHPQPSSADLYLDLHATHTGMLSQTSSLCLSSVASSAVIGGLDFVASSLFGKPSIDANPNRAQHQVPFRISVPWRDLVVSCLLMPPSIDANAQRAQHNFFRLESVPFDITLSRLTSVGSPRSKEN